MGGPWRAPNWLRNCVPSVMRRLCQKRGKRTWGLRALAVATMLSGLATGAQAATLEQMAGQMILVGFAGDSVSETAEVAKMLKRGEAGGVMYLATNVGSLKQVQAMNARFSGAGASLPPFIALDQEGGAVERLTRKVGFKEIPSAADVAAKKSPAQAEVLYADLAKRLGKLGFNLNFGPVVDLNINTKNPIIARYGRSYGADASRVVRYARAFVEGHHSAGVLTALKHFPGHGSSRGDSHEGFVDITKTWQARELDPYKALISGGQADMVMVAHLYHAKFAPKSGPRLPASLSPEWITGILRTHLGYDGVVVTDDLEMGAIRKQYGLKEAVVRAVQAGSDILLFSNTAKPRASLAREVRTILVQKAETDPEFQKRIAQSYRRIVALKQRIR